MVGEKRYTRRTSVSFICQENTQIIKLKLKFEMIEKIKKLEVLAEASTSLILTQIVETKIESLTTVKRDVEAKMSNNQYVMPKSLINKIKYAAITHDCHGYEVVGQCILDLTVEDENAIIKKLLAKFRALGIV